jgi:YD repeat-containing protein
MKKLIIYGVACALCLTAGCKKDNQKVTKTYLLKQQVTDDSANGIPPDTANYAYDDHNRVTTLTDGSGPNKITFAVTYDAQGRVNTAKKMNYLGSLIIEYDFFYGGDNTGYYFFGPSHVADTAVFVFDGKHQVSEIDTKHSGRTTFDYDTRGNVASTQEYGTDGVNDIVNQDDYAYDTMKNPFSQLPSGNLFLEYIVFIDNPSTLINNVANKNGEPFSYTYNPAGFPLSAVITLYNQSKVKVYYNYITK